MKKGKGKKAKSALPKAAATKTAPTAGSKAPRAESKKIRAFSAKLPDEFTKEFQGRTFKVARVGKPENNEWSVDGKKVGGIRAAMNVILVAVVGKNNGRTADNFFAGALRQQEKAAA